MVLPSLLDLAHFAILTATRWYKTNVEGMVPGWHLRRWGGGGGGCPLSSGEVTANSCGLLCHTQAMGPRLVSWPQAEEGCGDLIPVFAKALCSLGMVGGQGVGMGTPQGQDSLIPPRVVGGSPTLEDALL